MVNEKITKYYLLCSVRMGMRKHIVNELPDKKINVIFTGKEISLYFRQQDGCYVAREIIIGGNTSNTNNTVIVIE
jgi:hypothetical protein